ncbi:hypothetical protein J2T60_000289 [Natronospira proteinivora]|uniref:PepSY-associated transmembrane protein n=1 Tax=Natronospira proteinivora TaxID=1807133 RepID=A0ABT1G4V2_9GAMM|nr:PepSY domain-containing protein [Natronospira proteinivora]MCP1726324.1 hypothetical protein [Natronospira proteinivora]
MAGSLKKQLLRWLMPLHRYLGLGLSLLMLLWFISGIVMMFHGYPRMADSERLSALSTMETEKLAVPVEAAASRLGLEAIDGVRLNQPWDRPKLHVLSEHGWQSLYADSGEVVPPLDRVTLESRLDEETAWVVRAIDRLERPDQWTLSAGFDAFRPLWRVSLADSVSTTLYFSEATGERVHQTTGSERGWAYAGAIVHWIYPTRLREMSGFWRQLVMWLAGLGLLACLSGLILGLMMLKRRRRKGMSPYRGWMQWHHYLGLAFGVLVATWLLSGLLSLDPFRWASADRAPVSMDVTMGAPMSGSLGQWLAIEPAGVPERHASSTREVKLWQFMGRPYLLLSNESGERELWSASESPSEMFLSRQQIREAADGLPGMSLQGFHRQADYDHYYYPGRAARVRGEKPPLPVYRAEYDNGVHLYIFPKTGEVLRQSTPRRRLNRWLYNGLHSLDFPVLNPGSMGWYALVVVLMSGGALFSLTGVWFTVRYFKRK